MRRPSIEDAAQCDVERRENAFDEQLKNLDNGVFSRIPAPNAFSLPIQQATSYTAEIWRGAPSRYFPAFTAPQLANFLEIHGQKAATEVIGLGSYL